MADVVIGGLGQNQSASGDAERVLIGVGTPGFNVEIENEGAVVQPTYPNTSKDQSLGAAGTPVFGNRESRNGGAVQQDPNDNRSLQVELGGPGTPTFIDLATTFASPIQDPNSNRSLQVKLGGTGTPIFPSTEVRYLGTVLNFNP